MSETGFKCPECGNKTSFDASCVMLVGNTHITPDGWNYFDFPNDVVLHDCAVIKCCECGYEDASFIFQRCQEEEWWPRKEEA